MRSQRVFGLLTCLVAACPLLWAADGTPPSIPMVIDDGIYTTSNTSLHASWSSADGESGIVEYQYQIRQGSPSGSVIVAWTSVGTTTEATRSGFVSGSGKTQVNGLTNGVTCFWEVKARNGEGLWSASGFSDGITVDVTPPAVVAVTDDGPSTPSTTTLHATWTPSSDQQSGIGRYLYQITRDSPSGALAVDWTPIGLSTAVTRTGLSLTSGARYYINVKAENGAGLQGPVGSSDGIVAGETDTTPPILNSIFPFPGPQLYAGGTFTISVSVTDTDPSPLEYQFSVDGVVKQAWGAASSYAWVTSTIMSGPHTLLAEVRDAGGSDALAQSVYLYLMPPELP